MRFADIAGYDALKKALGRELVAVRAFEQGGRPFLCAFYDGEAAEPAALAERLGAYLPAYMIPARFVNLERFPVNAAGKVDHESLRLPESLTVRAVRELLETPPSPQAESGRLVYGSAWYYAAVVPAEAERPDLGSCRLRFLPGREWLPARLVAVSEEQDGCVALLFRLNRGGDYLRLRQCEAQWREIK